ncbi:MAG TPA: FecR domain-containing protein [Longimicrobium sp.]
MNDPDRTSAPADDAVWRAVARSLAGEATPDEEAALRRQLDGHPQRAALVAALDGALAGLRADAAPEVDVEAALASVMARRDRPALTVERGGVADAPPPRRPAIAPQPARWRTPAWMRIAAALVLLAGGALLWRALSNRGGPWQIQYATRTGMRQEVSLPDGSRVVLGPASRLAVARDYGRPARSVELHGQAYFEVTHDDAHEFSVSTPAARVTDVGTAFSVATDDAAAGTRVVVTSGAVAVTPSGRAATLLHAGDRAAVVSGAVTVQRGVATAEDVAWTQGRLVFRDATVADVAAELKRWYGVNLRVDDPALAGRHLTADFQGQTADGALRIIAATLGGQLRMRGDTAVIESPRGETRSP